MTVSLPIRPALAAAALLLVLAGGHAAAAAPVPAAGGNLAPAAEAGSIRVAVGGEVAFDDLVHYVGATVRVSTNIRTVREGVVTGASSVAFNLQVNSGARSFALAMPRERVERIVLLADAP